MVLAVIHYNGPTSLVKIYVVVNAQTYLMRYCCIMLFHQLMSLVVSFSMTMADNTLHKSADICLQ